MSPTVLHAPNASEDRGRQADDCTSFASAELAQQVNPELQCASWHHAAWIDKLAYIDISAQGFWGQSPMAWAHCCAEDVW